MCSSVLFGSGYPEENGNTTENTVFADGRTCIHSFFCAKFWNFGFGVAPWHGASSRDGHVVTYFSTDLLASSIHGTRWGGVICPRSESFGSGPMSWCLQLTYNIKATSISVAALSAVVYTECWVDLYPHKRLRERLGLSLLHFAPRWLIGSSRIDHRDSGPRSETKLTYKPIFSSLIYWWFSTSFNSRDSIVHPVTPWLFHNIFEATTEEWTSAQVDDF